MKRHVFMISDGTGITAELLGNSLLAQFERVEFEKHTIPYVDSIEKAEIVLERINQTYSESESKPLVFMTLVNPQISIVIKQANACLFDLYNTFLDQLEIELGTESSDAIGRAHGLPDNKTYDQRIEAVNFALTYDDGVKPQGYDHADIILIGVSRCGKTPSCLYMALRFGIYAANYPFTDEDLSDFRLPELLRPYKQKLFGLTIAPERLQNIRTERRPNSNYASAEQCRREVAEVEMVFQRENIPFINSTYLSIEEIATKIISIAKIKRRI